MREDEGNKNGTSERQMGSGEAEGEKKQETVKTGGT